MPSTPCPFWGGGEPSWLIVDHYAIDRRWEQLLRPQVDRIMVIDDLADRPHDCDLLLDQNLYHDMETRYDRLVPGGCRKLLGPRYALLRPEFTAARNRLRQRDGVLRRILVFFGGVDPTNETEKALKALAGIAERPFTVDVVVGGGNPHKERIRDICSLQGFHFHCQVDTMAELMATADLAIGAGGTATWERCAVGLPGLVVSLADNQSELTFCGAERGIIFLLGDRHSVSADTLSAAVRTFLLSPQNLMAYTERCLKTIDARGVQRVAAAIMPPPITMREATRDDCDAILDWRNAEETRKQAFDPAPIPLDMHRRWFHSALDDPDRVILIGEISEGAIGVVRYDICGAEAVVSVYLVPGRQGQGLGTELLRAGTRWLGENRPSVRVINAEILSANQASRQAFEQAGYQEHHVTYRGVVW